MTEEIPTSTTSNNVTGSDTSVKLYSNVQLTQKMDKQSIKQMALTN